MILEVQKDEGILNLDLKIKIGDIVDKNIPDFEVFKEKKEAFQKILKDLKNSHQMVYRDPRDSEIILYIDFSKHSILEIKEEILRKVEVNDNDMVKRTILENYKMKDIEILF